MRALLLNNQCLKPVTVKPWLQGIIVNIVRRFAGRTTQQVVQTPL